jgi:hypothetical protein
MNISIDEIRVLIGVARRGLLYLSFPYNWPDPGDLDYESAAELKDCAEGLKAVNDKLREYAPDVDQLVE